MPPSPENWRTRSRPIAPGSAYPAQDLCSQCGLCDTYYIAHVKEACAFLGSGMTKVEDYEPRIHGRGRTGDLEQRFGVHQALYYARLAQPVAGAQWTGLVTAIALTLLETGTVEGVVCVQSDPDDRFTPRPVIATTPEEILKARGVKPTLSPNLKVLELVDSIGLKRLLFCGVGCQVQALRAVEEHLNLEALYVIGTHCVDNGTRSGLDRFLRVVSQSPETVLHYEFMQDYQVHLKHLDGRFETIPYFCLPTQELQGVIAPSCYSCFDYMNGLADLVVGYMGVPYQGVPMTEHYQQVTVRNAKGQAMFEQIKPKLWLQPPFRAGNCKTFVLQTLLQEERSNRPIAADGNQQSIWKIANTRFANLKMPKFLGRFLAWMLTKLGPQGLEFAQYSIDYHTLRNYLYVKRRSLKPDSPKYQTPKHQTLKHRQNSSPEPSIPAYAQAIVQEYDQNQSISQLLQ